MLIREVAGFKERTNQRRRDDSGERGSLEWEWHFQPFRARDGFRRAGHKSVQVCVRRGNWSGNKAISDFTPVSTKVSSSRSIFGGSPASSASVRPPLVPIFGKDRGGRIRHLTRSVGRIELHVFPIFFTFYGDGFPAGRPSVRPRQSVVHQFFLLMSLT